VTTCTTHTDTAADLAAQLDRQSRLVDYLCARLADAERREYRANLDHRNLADAQLRLAMDGRDFTPAEHARLDQVAAAAREAKARADEVRRLTFAAADREAALERQALQIGGV
jgi:hypothetical protein